MCPSCGSSDIENNESSGDTVCINCGVVIEESNIVSAVEFAEVSGTWSAGFLAGAHSSHCRALGDQPPLLGNMWPRQRRSLSRPRCLCMDSRRSRVRYAGNRVACASGLSRVVCVRVRTCACVCACVRACVCVCVSALGQLSRAGRDRPRTQAHPTACSDSATDAALRGGAHAWKLARWVVMCRAVRAPAVYARD